MDTVLYYSFSVRNEIHFFLAQGREEIRFFAGFIGMLAQYDSIYNSRETLSFLSLSSFIISNGLVSLRATTDYSNLVICCFGTIQYRVIFIWNFSQLDFYFIRINFLKFIYSLHIFRSSFQLKVAFTQSYLSHRIVDNFPGF